MTQLWYYVQDGERIGPVAQAEIIELLAQKKLNLESYVWRKGFSDWMHVEDVKELATYVTVEVEPEVEEVIETQEAVEEDDFTEPVSAVVEIEEEIEEEEDNDEDEEIELKPMSLHELNLAKAKFFIRTGDDRGGVNADYGPFTFLQIKKLLTENRINDKTLVFSSQMDYWRALGSFSDFEDIFSIKTTFVPAASERRSNLRKPFIARMFFSNREDVFEGLCRDISIGGMQVLLDHYPGEAGEKISINVHPKNDEYNFVASGTVVRVLEGRKGFSFRFIDLSTQAKNAIEKYVQEGN